MTETIILEWGSYAIYIKEIMKKGTKVSWTIKGRNGCGTGTVVMDEDDGYVFVAVDQQPGETSPGYHAVIHCTVTGLTEVPAVVVENAS